MAEEERPREEGLIEGAARASAQGRGRRGGVSSFRSGAEIVRTLKAVADDMTRLSEQLGHAAVQVGIILAVLQRADGESLQSGGQASSDPGSRGASGRGTRLQAVGDARLGELRRELLSRLKGDE